MSQANNAWYENRRRDKELRAMRVLGAVERVVDRLAARFLGMRVR